MMMMMIIIIIIIIIIYTAAHPARLPSVVRNAEKNIVLWIATGANNHMDFNP